MPDESSLRDRLVGAWRLVSYSSRDIESGAVSYPMGKNATGWILYTPDGYMSAQIQAETPASDYAVGDPHGGTDREAATAARGYLAYSGPYQVTTDETLTHHMGVSLFPNWLGQTQVRTVELAGRRLRLRPVDAVTIDGSQQMAEVVWERV
jgi:hypothetical protein